MRFLFLTIVSGAIGITCNQLFGWWGLLIAVPLAFSIGWLIATYKGFK